MSPKRSDFILSVRAYEEANDALKADQTGNSPGDPAVGAMRQHQEWSTEHPAGFVKGNS
jgi:hypothetical protein